MQTSSVLGSVVRGEYNRGGMHSGAFSPGLSWFDIPGRLTLRNLEFVAVRIGELKGFGAIVVPEDTDLQRRIERFQPDLERCKVRRGEMKIDAASRIAV